MCCLLFYYQIWNLKSDQDWNRIFFNYEEITIKVFLSTIGEIVLVLVQALGSVLVLGSLLGLGLVLVLIFVLVFDLVLILLLVLTSSSTQLW